MTPYLWKKLPLVLAGMYLVGSMVGIAPSLAANEKAPPESPTRWLGGFSPKVLEKNNYYFTVSTEFYSEKYIYDSYSFEQEDWGWDEADYPERDFEGNQYYEWATNLTAYYGIGMVTQIGVTIPVIQRYLEKDEADTISTLADSTSETSLGKIALILNHFAEFMDGDASVFSELTISLPTDSGDEIFYPGETEITLAFYGERYWGSIGNLPLSPGNGICCAIRLGT